MYWYNPKTRSSERIPSPKTDEEALRILEGDPESDAFVEEYIMLREDGMSVEQAMIFVGQRLRMLHLKYQAVG